jgi:hypothetical protein
MRSVLLVSAITSIATVRAYYFAFMLVHYPATDSAFEIDEFHTYGVCDALI